MTEAEAEDPLAAVPLVSVAELGVENALALLEHGTLEVVGQLRNASNATLFCAVTLDGVTVGAAHKPIAGERPLRDFPDGTLAAREVAAYQVSAASGWDLIPPTVLREGPWGPGMCQLWVDVDENAEVFVFERDRDGYVSLDTLVPVTDDRLRRLSVLDVVLNNADRKGGHVLASGDGRLHGIDHGLCFSDVDKLRTILWAWADQPLTTEALEVLERLGADFDSRVGPVLAELLEPREVAKTQGRINRLLRTGRHPKPRDDGYPALPWPPF
ncbi:MAG: SCO1664 family protein [Sporichthyaceae bacterium]